MEVQYFCRLRPLGEYFIGGEKTFDFGGSKGSAKSNYFIHSEEEISQATILGMIRFVILKKNDLLSDGWNDKGKKEQQKAFIGANGFTIDSSQKTYDYGKLKNISPVFVYEGDELLLHAPLNHKTYWEDENKKSNKNEKYMPFHMCQTGYSDMGQITYVPEDFVAKDGLCYDFMKLNDEEIIDRSDVFQKQIRTRVSKNSAEDGFFKRTYQFLKKGYSFGFYITMEEGWCPETTVKDEIVYMGQEKSAFVLSFERKDRAELKLGTEADKNPDYQVYYIASDSYIEDFSLVKNMICYAIIEKKSYRFLTLQTGNNYAESRRMSERFQFVKAGSVFYVRNGRGETFKAAFSETDLSRALQQIGFNQMIRIGE